MAQEKGKGEVWVFGDYRDYLKNRVTLELIARARILAEDLGTRCGTVVLGQRVAPYIMEYIAHGSQVIYVMQSPHLAHFRATAYTQALCHLVEQFSPEILLIGGTDFGREFAPRVAKKLSTGLSADCVALEIDPVERILIQTTPAFGGRLLAEVVTPDRRPQMATVRPGTFRELPHDAAAKAPVVYVEPLKSVEGDRLETLSMEKIRESGDDLTEAAVVISGGRGMGSERNFQLLNQLADLLGGEVGGTRPAVIQGWIPEERMIGQTGCLVRPRILITCGTSGALQYTAAIRGADFIIAINRDAEAPIFREADLGIVGDAREIVSRLIQMLTRRRAKEDVFYG